MHACRSTLEDPTVGVTLTIESGVQVLARDGGGGNPAGGSDNGRIELIVGGTLVAQGGADAHVTFASETGGTQSGEWYGVVFQSTAAASSLAWIDVSNGHRCLSASGTAAGAVLIAHATVQHCSEAGVDVRSNGALGLSDANVSDAPYGIALRSAASGLTLTRVAVHHATTYGIYSEETTYTLASSAVYANNHGVYASEASPPGNAVTITSSTIARNTNHGVVGYRSYYSSTLSFDVTDSVVAENGGYGFYGCDYYAPTLTYTYTDLWGNQSEQGCFGVLATTGSFSFNPLFVDGAAFDLRPTSRSPLRYKSSTGGVVGARAYEGDATPGWHGWYWDDATFAAGDYVVDGDIVVPARKIPGSGASVEDSADDVPPTLTLQPGAVLAFTKGDVTKAGASAQRGELVVDGRLAADGTVGSAVTLRSAEGAAAPGDWYGIVVNAGAAAFSADHVHVQHATIGVSLEGTAFGVTHAHIESASTFGVRARGAASPLIEGCLIEDARDCGVYVETGTPTLRGNVIRDNENYGVFVSNVNGTLTLEGNQIYERDGAGRTQESAVYAVRSGSGSTGLHIDRQTIHGHAGHGVVLYRTYYSSTLDVDITDSVIAENGGYGVYSCDYYASTGAITYSDVWGNAGGEFGCMSLSSQAGTYSYNPLFADAGAANFAPTSRSPLRYTGSSGGVVGAVAYAGAATPGYAGFYWESYAFPVGGQYAIAGDIVIPARRIPGSGLDPVDAGDDEPARVAIRPGTRLSFAAGDVMGGGADPQRGEIVVDGILEADGTVSQPVTLKSGTASPAPGDWYGVRVNADAFAFNIDNIKIQHARYGVYMSNTNHVVSSATIELCQTAGVYVSGGSPTIVGTRIHDVGGYGVQIAAATPTLRDTLVYENGADNVYVDNSTGTVHIDHCAIYGLPGGAFNPTRGVYAVHGSSGTATVSIAQSTLHGHASYGVEAYRGYYNGTLAIELRDSAVTGNGSAGVWGCAYYQPTISYAYTDIWDNGQDGTPCFTVGSTTGAFSYNPLYVNADTGDFRPTTRSPLRCTGSTGGTVGYGAYDGVPTPVLAGVLNGDLTLTVAQSPWTIDGDLIVKNNCGATPSTLTIEAGAVVRFAKPDVMKGGSDAARSELRVMEALVLDGTAQQVLLESAAAEPARGDWYGVTFEDEPAVTVRGVRIEDARYGFRGAPAADSVLERFVVNAPAVDGVSLEGATRPTVRECEIEGAGGNGISVSGGTAATIDRCESSRGAGDGVRLVNVEGTSVVQRSVAVDNGTNGIYVQDSNADLTNNVLLGADAGVHGYRSGSTARTLRLFDNTLYDIDGIGVYVQNTYYTGSYTLEARNNVVAWCDSYAFYSDWYTVANTLSHNGVYETDGYSGISAGSPSWSWDPMFEDVDPSGRRRWHDLRLLNNSPYIDIGASAQTYAGVPAIDLLGTTRPKGASVELGAYEYDATLNRDPWAAAGADQLVPMGDLVFFSAAGTTDPDAADVDELAYVWSFGDGGIASGPSVAHVFANNTIHEVILVVTDPHGGEDHDVVTVDVNARPVAEAGPDLFADAQIETVYLNGNQSTDVDGTIVAYHWDFGDGEAADGLAPSHVYAVPSVYTITLTATDNDGHTGTDSTTAYIFGDGDTLPPVITHTRVADGRPEAQALTIDAEIEDPSGVASATLYYRKAGDAQFTAAAMTNPADHTWRATIPAASVTLAGVHYYLSATDEAEPGNTGTVPGGAPSSWYAFTVVSADTTPPTITHTPIAGPKAAGSAVVVSATLTDLSGIFAAKLRHRATGATEFTEVSMSNVGGDTWTGTIPGAAVTTAGVDYTLAVTDASSNRNGATSPADAPSTVHRFTVNAVDQSGPVITHTALANGQPSGLAANVSANITDASGVARVTLNYKKATDASYSSRDMTNTSGSTWEAQIPSNVVTTAGVHYFIFATDSAPAQNQRFAPATAPGTPYAFTVAATDASGPSITHTPIADGREAGQPISIAASVTDTSGVASVTLSWRVQGATDFTTVAMSTTGGSNYGATIAGAGVAEPGLEYYLRAVDGSASSNASTLPAGAPANLQRFTVLAPDDDPPVIAHTPPGARAEGAAVTLTASVSDASGVAGVTLSYRRSDSDGAFTSLAMAHTGGGSWSATIPAAAVVAPGVEYYLSAEDTAEPTHVATSPGGAPGTLHAFAVNAAGGEDGGTGGDDGGAGGDDGGTGGDDGGVTPPDTTPPAITHTPLADGQTAGLAVSVTASVHDTSGVASVLLYYRRSNIVAWSVTALAPVSGEVWSGSIPAASVTTAGVDYYLAATDDADAANASADPAGAPASFHAFTVEEPPPGPDTTPPVIAHTPIADGRPAGRPLALFADVTDASGVQSVSVYHRPSGSAGAFTVLALSSLVGATWQGTLAAAAVAPPGVEYFVYAVDAAPAHTSASEPAGAPGVLHTFTVVDVDAPSIVHTPVANGRPAGAAVAVSANVTDASGVASVSVHYRATGGGAFTALPLAAAGGNTWTGSVPGAAVGAAGVEYYLSARDTAGTPNTAYEPAGAPGSVHAFTVTVSDASGPSITFTPPSAAQPSNQSVALSASVTDPSGVAEVVLFHRVHGTVPFTQTAMTHGAGDAFSGTIPAASVTVAGVDYYLQARDSAAGANVSVHPAGAPGTLHTLTVRDAEPPRLTHTRPAAGEGGAELALFVDVTDASPLAGVTLQWRTGSTGAFTAVALSRLTGASWQGTVPAAGVAPPAVEYFLSAADSASPANAATDPANAPASVHRVPVADTRPPALAHTPPDAAQPAGAALVLAATASDFSGVTAVTLFARAPGAAAFTEYAALRDGAGDGWRATVPAAAVAPPGLEYWFAALDGAATPHRATSPATAPAALHAVAIAPPPRVLHEGDLLVTEFLYDPTGREASREWFELYNATDAPIDLRGLRFADADGEAFTVSAAEPIDVDPDGYAVLARSANPDENGGVAVDYVYTGFNLSNAGDEIIVSFGGVELDRVAYDASFPHQEGRSVQVDPEARDLEANDDATRWCLAGAALPGGDFGTPGAANASCGPAADHTPPAIVHTPLADGAPMGVAAHVVATVTDASGVLLVELMYRNAADATFAGVALVNAGGDAWAGDIPAALVHAPGVEYYLQAVDASPAGNVALAPTLGAGGPYAFVPSTDDLAGPNLVLDGALPAFTEGVGALVGVLASDASGVASVTLHVRANAGAAWTERAMTHGDGDRWTAGLEATDLVAPGVQLWFRAVDASPAANAAALPAAGAAGPFDAAVTPVDRAAPSVRHTAVAGRLPEGVAVPIELTASDAGGPAGANGAVARAFVAYRTSGSGAEFATLELTRGAGERWSGAIPAASVAAPGLDYYVGAEDAAKNEATLPEGAPASFYRVDVGALDDAPEIRHTPLTDGIAVGAPLSVLAVVVSPHGIGSAALLHRPIVPAGQTPPAFVTIPMERRGGGDVWGAEIPGEAMTSAGVEYFLRAVDASADLRTATSPADAPAHVHRAVPAAGGGDDGDGTETSGGGGCTNAPPDESACTWMLVAAALALPRLRRTRSRADRRSAH